MRSERPAARITADEILTERVRSSLDKARAKVDPVVEQAVAEIVDNDDDAETVDRSDEIAELFAAEADSEA